MDIGIYVLGLPIFLAILVGASIGALVPGPFNRIRRRAAVGARFA
jgi:hypothetical protein